MDTVVVVEVGMMMVVTDMEVAMIKVDMVVAMAVVVVVVAAMVVDMEGVEDEEEVVEEGAVDAVV